MERVRLSRGVVGRTTYAVVSLFLLLAVVASRASVDLLLYVAGLGVVTFLVYFIGVLMFATKHPAVAMMEGAELLHWQQAELAAKGTGPVPPPAILPAPPTTELPPSSGV